MNIERAGKIAQSFADDLSLQVSQLQNGLLVQYRMSRHYFTREASFWAYIYSLAGLRES